MKTTSLIATVVEPAHAQAERLLELLQSEYVGLYGIPDPNPEGDLTYARHPGGGVVLVWRGVDAVAVGGWTRSLSPSPLTAPHSIAVLRRMYVHYAFRGQGLARYLLAAIEEDARAEGITRMVLETGTAQTIAIELYRSSGYTPTGPFGYYADSPDSVFLGKEL